MQLWIQWERERFHSPEGRWRSTEPERKGQEVSEEDERELRRKES